MPLFSALGGFSFFSFEINFNHSFSVSHLMRLFPSHGHMARARQPLSLSVTVVCALAVSGCVVSPEPFSDAQFSQTAQGYVGDIYAGQEPVKGSIDLGEAMARAVLYNLDDRVQQAENLLRSRELASANIAMLPGLTAGAGRNLRNKVDASSSFDVGTGKQSLATSTSQDEAINTSNAALAWNVLDLGQSYVRARQASDQVLAAEERRRRVLARLIEEVRIAYWRALAAEHLVNELPKVEARAKAALEQSRMLIKDGNVSPLTALAYQKEIYEIQERVQSVQSEVVTAKAQLAALMNLPPGTQFSLVRPKAQTSGRLPDAKSMLTSALTNRPEVREALYQERIDSQAKALALLETLPSVNVFLRANTTSNSYTLNKEWLGYGAEASWNLMKIFTLPMRQAEAEAKGNLAQERARAMMASVALQVAISRDRYAQAMRRLQTASDFESVQSELLEQLKASTSAARSGDQELVREELSSLYARARYDMALAEVQAAWAVVQTTMGRDPYPALAGKDLPELKAAFRAKLAGREPPPRKSVVDATPERAPLVIMAEGPVATHE